jgi:predicted small lipoprotein YifL
MRKLIAVIFAVVIGFALTACGPQEFPPGAQIGGSANPTAGVPPAPPPAPVPTIVGHVFYTPLGGAMTDGTTLLTADPVPTTAIYREAGYSLIVTYPYPFHGVELTVRRGDSKVTPLAAHYNNSTASVKSFNTVVVSDGTLTLTRLGDVRWAAPADWAPGLWGPTPFDAKLSSQFVMIVGIDPNAPGGPLPIEIAAVRIIR